MPKSWFLFEAFFPYYSWLCYFDGVCRERCGLSIDEIRQPEHLSELYKCIDLVLFAELVENGKRFHLQ